MVQRLHDFSLDECIFTLGKFSPVSIRDQVVRGYYLIDSLCELGVINRTCSIAIVGAGAGGIACALAALHAGLSPDAISVFESEKSGMPLQARARTRWIDPVQYDWPARFWECETWPVPNTRTAVRRPIPPMIAALGPKWAIDFQNQLESGRVVPYYEHQVVDYAQVGDYGVRLEIEDTKTGSTMTRNFDVLILAVGFGREISYLSDGKNILFEGVGFWGDDKFETDTKGLANGGKVLISGSGDGALQDFVRLVTGLKSVRELMKKIWTVGSADAKWKEGFQGLWHWEQNARSSRSYLTKNYDECQLLAHLHSLYQDVIDELSGSSDWDAVRVVLDLLTLDGKRANVELLSKCTHFAWCYPLNRVAALLLLKYLATKRIYAQLQRTALKGTLPLEHSKCEEGCWGLKHVAHLARGTSCEHSGKQIRDWPVENTEDDVYLGLVLRHGIQPPDTKVSKGKTLVNQELPMHLP